MKRVHADVFNSFWRIPTPENAPLRAGIGEMYRFRTRPICAKCGKGWPKPLIIQYPKFSTEAGLLIPQTLPSIHDSAVMEDFMVRASNIGTGCWIDCKCGRNWNMKCNNQCVMRGLKDRSGWGPAREGDCMCICACVPRCGNKKVYPCRCGYVDQFHMKDCPVGLFKRDSSFLLPYARQKMIEAGRRRERVLRGR